MRPILASEAEAPAVLGPEDPAAAGAAVTVYCPYGSAETYYTGTEGAAGGEADVVVKLLYWVSSETVTAEAYCGNAGAVRTQYY